MSNPVLIATLMSKLTGVTSNRVWNTTSKNAAPAQPRDTRTMLGQSCIIPTMLFPMVMAQPSKGSAAPLALSVKGPVSVA